MLWQFGEMAMPFIRFVGSCGLLQLYATFFRYLRNDIVCNLFTIAVIMAMRIRMGFCENLLVNWPT